jgi:hypothetical protein
MKRNPALATVVVLAAVLVVGVATGMACDKNGKKAADGSGCDKARAAAYQKTTDGGCDKARAAGDAEASDTSAQVKRAGSSECPKAAAHRRAANDTADGSASDGTSAERAVARAGSGGCPYAAAAKKAAAAHGDCPSKKGAAGAETDDEKAGEKAGDEPAPPVKVAESASESSGQASEG